MVHVAWCMLFCWYEHVTCSHVLVDMSACVHAQAPGCNERPLDRCFSLQPRAPLSSPM